MRHQIPTRDQIIARIADRQGGVVSLEQLLAAGISKNAVMRSIRAGRLRPLFRGVYAVGHVALSRQGWWTAALLACGPGAVLGYGSAATAWGFNTRPTRPVEVIITGDRGRQQRNLVVHRTALHPTDSLLLEGLRVTVPARTIVDMTATSTSRELRRIVERAQDLHRFQPDAIRPILDRVPGRRGCRQLRDLITLMEPDEDKARSHLERLFLKVIRKARLPLPEVNHPIGDRRRDFVWPEQRLVVEVDGYQWHSTKEAKRRDHQRDRELTALAWRPVRFTYEDVVFEPEDVVTELPGLLRG